MTCHDSIPKVTYADDVTAVVMASNYEELESDTNNAMNNLIRFFAGSGLKLNNTKTELINHNGQDVEVIVSASGEVQKSAKSARLLGIIVDSNLNFHAHIDLMLKDIEYRMWLFRKVAKIANTKNRLIYAHGLLFSKFIFGIQCYAGTDQTYLEKVRIAYDKCVRLTFGKNPDNLTTAQMRQSLRILPFESLVKLMDLTTFREIVKTGSPERLYDLIQTRFVRDSRQVQNGHLRVLKAPKTEKLRRTFLYRVVPLWNSLTNELKNLTKSQFHDTVKRFLLGAFNGPGRNRPIPMISSNNPNPFVPP